MDPSNCVICRIEQGKEPAEIVGETEKAIAFAPLEPTAAGHTVVAPRAHAADIRSISSDDLGAVMELAKHRAESLMEGDAAGVNILHASGRAAQQSVFHFHVHVVPRKDGDGLDLWIAG
jgi:histidine triad (HIT) family protein